MPKKTVRSLVKVLSGGLILAGCESGDPAPPAPTLSPTAAGRVAVAVCAPDLASWDTFPPDYDAQRYATALQVNEESVRNGSFGLATCVPPLTFEQASQLPLVSVIGIGNICLAVRVASELTPQPGQVFPDVGVVCPATLEPSPS